MSQNPYEASKADTPTRPTRWMLATGSISLCLAALCLLVTVLMMMRSFSTIANSGNSPTASGLASDISTAMIPMVAAPVLGLVGIVFLILGFVRRQPGRRLENSR